MLPVWAASIQKGADMVQGLKLTAFGKDDERSKDNVARSWARFLPRHLLIICSSVAFPWLNWKLERLQSFFCKKKSFMNDEACVYTLKLVDGIPALLFQVLVLSGKEVRCPDNMDYQSI